MARALDTAMRTLIGFALVYILTRLSGKKALGQASIFTYITGISMGNMVGDMIIHKDVEIIDGIIGMTLWAILMLFFELISLNSFKLRSILEGEPSFLIKRGVIQEKVMRKIRMNMETLSSQLREKDIFSIQEVQYAIVEPHGELSIIKKSQKQCASKEDLGISALDPAHIPCRLITDGNLIVQNLDECGKDIPWINAQLLAQNIYSIKSVLYAEIDSNDSLFVQKKQ